MEGKAKSIDEILEAAIKRGQKRSQQKEKHEQKKKAHVDLWGWYETGENKNNEPILMIYAPEYAEEDTCPMCDNEIDLGKLFLEKGGCPHCGQPFLIESFMT